MTSLFERPTVHLLGKFVLDGQNEELCFMESRKRGQKRKERKIQIVIQKKEEKIS
jgi:hypothetical protein